MGINANVFVELANGEVKLNTTVSLRIVQVKVKANSRLYRGSTLLTYETARDSGPSRSASLKSPFDGIVTKILVKTDMIVECGETIIELKCNHPMVVKHFCAQCGADLRCASFGRGASQSMAYGLTGSRAVGEAKSSSTGKGDEIRLLAHKKLVLLVDLDQTLVHTACGPIDGTIQGVHHFRTPGIRSTWYHTRIRPETEEFLEKMSQLFELYVFTFGGRKYAERIFSLIDPNNEYFQGRILSRDECVDRQSKAANLKSLFPHGDNLVAMIDDRKDVWDFAPNLVPVKPYVFFRHTGDINAPTGSPAERYAFPASEKRTCTAITEDKDDHLSHLTQVLTKIHEAFYNRYEQRRTELREGFFLPDLKQVIPEVRRKVLEDVVIVFSGCFPLNQDPGSAAIYRLAIALGATVVGTLSHGVTHLVAARSGTAKVRQAGRFPGIKVVSCQWLLSCAERWEKTAEVFFPPGNTPLDAKGGEGLSDGEKDQCCFEPSLKRQKTVAALA